MGNRQGDVVDLLRNCSLGQYKSLFVRILRVQFSNVRIPNTNQQWWHNPAETARPLPNPHESVRVTRPEQTRADQTRSFLLASLNVVKTSEETRPSKICTASYASNVSLSTESYLYSL